MSTLQIGSEPCRCGLPRHGTKLIALTGGPGAGKTAVLEMAARSFCAHVAILPEAASIIFGGGFPRHDTLAGMHSAQRAIFQVQRELETLVIEEGRVAIGLCDRGTVDGQAYWPESTASYWEALGTSRKEELARYTAVIHLETPAASQGYNHQNALRIESADEARRIDGRIKDAWSGHERRVIISSTDSFLEKASQALQVIRSTLPECCHTHPLPGVESAGGGHG